jgi:uncharacterized membrane protein
VVNLKVGLALILLAVSLSVFMTSSGTEMNQTNSTFDMNGTITKVLSPSSIVVGTVAVNLDDVDASGLNNCAYPYLMRDLEYYIGKNVFVKGNKVYLDLIGAYNSVSINEQIQMEILSLEKEQEYGNLCESLYYEGYLGYEERT